jgi:hypothetical protein
MRNARRIAGFLAIGLMGLASIFANGPGLVGKSTPKKSAQLAGTSAQLMLQDAFSKLKFSRPVSLSSARDGTPRLFVVEQDGKIFVFKNSSTVAAAKIFLDLSGLVLSPARNGHPFSLV